MSHEIGTITQGLVFSDKTQARLSTSRSSSLSSRSARNALSTGIFIRLHFQGTTTDAKGKVKMNSESPDATYTALLANLRAAMKALAKRIEPKVYEYGFLKG